MQLKKYLLLTITLFIASSLTWAKPSAVIFDCDGVLVDTEYLKFEAWRDALKERDVDFTIDEYLPLVGHSSKYIANDILKNKKVQIDQKLLISRKKQRYSTKQKQGVPPILSAVKFLNQLLEKKDSLGIKVAIVSSAAHQEILQNLTQIGVQLDRLDGIFSGHDDLSHIVDPEGTNKPKPYIYQLATAKLELDPNTTIVFEDTFAGIMAASSAGLTVLAVPNRFTEKHDFSLAKAVISFDTFTFRELEDLYDPIGA